MAESTAAPLPKLASVSLTLEELAFVQACVDLSTAALSGNVGKQIHILSLLAELDSENLAASIYDRLELIGRRML